jgi:hypothetical protein
MPARGKGGVPVIDEPGSCECALHEFADPFYNPNLSLAGEHFLDFREAKVAAVLDLSRSATPNAA